VDFWGFSIFVLTSIALLAGTGCGADGEVAPAAKVSSTTDELRAKRPRHVALEIETDGGVALTGTVQWEGDSDGVLRIDVLTLYDGRPPELIHQSSLEAGGEFAFELPQDLGEVHLVAYLDRNNNGPSAGEPVATQVVQVGSSEISPISLVLSVGTDLGRLAPGAPPPADAGPPPEDESGIVAPGSQAAADP
jgi:hypothetical protein